MQAGELIPRPQPRSSNPDSSADFATAESHRGHCAPTPENDKNAHMVTIDVRHNARGNEGEEISEPDIVLFVPTHGQPQATSTLPPSEVDSQRRHAIPCQSGAHPRGPDGTIEAVRQTCAVATTFVVLLSVDLFN